MPASRFRPAAARTQPLPPRAALRWTLAIAAVAAAALATAPGCRKSGRAAAGGEPPSSNAPKSGPPLAAARAGSGGYELTAAESAAIDDFLRRNPNLRPATDADRQGASGSDAEIRSLYGVYHPFFVRGDVNDDGILDFAIAFVRRDLGGGTPWFSVVVFTGSGGLGGPAAFSAGTFIERDVTLARGDLSIDRDSIVITPDLDDDTIRRYRWDPPGRGFVFVPDTDEDADSPSVSRTSAGGPPAVRF